MRVSSASIDRLNVALATIRSSANRIFCAFQGESGVSATGANAPPATPALEAPDTQAEGFDRARRARATELLEDYAELIDDLVRSSGQARPTDIARRLGVSHVTAVKAIARLEREGLALPVPHRGVTLTPAGQALAARVRARHRLVYDVLLALGVPPDDARADAEGIEHHVSPATLDAFARFLGRQ
jgi:DtxR family manganese transport transcriptional regulator